MTVTLENPKQIKPSTLHTPNIQRKARILTVVDDADRWFLDAQETAPGLHLDDFDRYPLLDLLDIAGVGLVTWIQRRFNSVEVYGCWAYVSYQICDVDEIDWILIDGTEIGLESYCYVELDSLTTFASALINAHADH